MALTELWQRYHTEGFEAVQSIKPENALDAFYLALLSFGEQDISRSEFYARQAAVFDATHLVFHHAHHYLARILHAGPQEVYTTGTGFAAFIRGGGNVPLYQATSAALRHVYKTSSPRRVFDIGVGDGMALLPALTDPIASLELLDPSAHLLEHVSDALLQRGIPHRTICSTLQAFIAQTASSPEHWDLIQATYSLQSLHPSERAATLRWIHDNGERLVMAEFDAPEFPELFLPARAKYFLERYHIGLAEYDQERNLVAQEFLMPVMFGAFDRTRRRINYEQSIAHWKDDLSKAGFTTVQTRVLYPYWWASAFLIEAY